METLLSMKGIHKEFGKVTALTNAEFHLEKGEVHALLGANGAGKSTLMKILSGVYQQDGGEILLDGDLVRFPSPKQAKDLGIYCVYQEVDTAIVAELSVAENIMLDTFASGGKLFVSKSKLYEEARMALKQLQVEHISVYQPAFMLSLAEKQLILIARALVHSAKLIIFDEPTAPLSLQESARLFSVINDLREKNVGCIYISHRLPEIFEISDRITVMREGTTIETFKTSEVSEGQIIESMLGETFSFELAERRQNTGLPLLEVKGLSDGQKLHDISLTVARGEIVGVVGLVGAGKTELANALFGQMRFNKGSVHLDNQLVNAKHPTDAIKAGMALVPEERRKEGLFVYESLQTNATFPNLRKFSPRLFMDKRAEKSFAEDIIKRLQIKTGSVDTPLVHLSGGNQQKVAIGKWMSLDSKLFLFDEPTKGVDIGAKVDIFKLIREIAEAGNGCLYFSCELQEIMGISDRILVMYNGRIVKRFKREEATQEKILLYASGGKEE